VALGEEFSSAEGERERLEPLLSSIIDKLRARKKNPKRLKEKERKKARWFPTRNEEDIYSPGSVTPLQ
jgi:hypothetical protein